MNRVRVLPAILLLAILSLFAPAPAHAKGLVRDYRFKRNLKDSRHGPSLVSLGGTVGKGIYTFEVNQGLQLDNAGVLDHYAIEITFRFDSVDGYRKILDFKDRALDTGFYVYDGQLNFYDFATGGAVEAGTLYRVRIERDRATGLVRGFVNDEAVFEFTDSANDAVFQDGKALFFVDDTPTESEASAGAVKRIRIWDRPFP